MRESSTCYKPDVRHGERERMDESTPNDSWPFSMTASSAAHSLRLSWPMDDTRALNSNSTQYDGAWLSKKTRVSIKIITHQCELG